MGPSRSNLMWRLYVGSLSECVVLVEFNYEITALHHRVSLPLCLGGRHSARSIVLP